ncbi:MAG TPA: hypothetical protein VGF99_05830 [Myxococcota bacterium]
MKKIALAAVAALALAGTACQSVESTKVDATTISTSNGEAVAVVQCTALGLTAIFHLVTITEASLDTVINKMLVAETKALGGNKVQLLSAGETPKGGLLFKLAGGILSIPGAQATGISVR